MTGDLFGPRGGTSPHDHPLVVKRCPRCSGAGRALGGVECGECDGTGAMGIYGVGRRLGALERLVRELTDRVFELENR